MQHKQYSSVLGQMILPWDESCIFLTQNELSVARDHVNHARMVSKPSTQRRHCSTVPEGAIMECQDSHRAASNRGDGSEDKWRSKGLMGAVCRHDIPLFMCDIRTPGEQQHYPVALLVALFRELPPIATVGLLYDIGCVLDLSIAKVSPSVVSHRWAASPYVRMHIA